ncbi:UNVERIFIED_CONTAM: hypothetical protein GTU68_053698 [Idotea baltica]|nr:hypothetical protein [Idotea baltica]
MYGLHGAEYVKPSTLFYSNYKRKVFQLLVSIIEITPVLRSMYCPTTATHTQL